MEIRHNRSINEDMMQATRRCFGDISAFSGSAHHSNDRDSIERAPK